MENLIKYEEKVDQGSQRGVKLPSSDILQIQLEKALHHLI